MSTPRFGLQARFLAASAVVWRMAGRWRQEGYFKYARTHFALDALDAYTDQPDDPARMVPNPAKKTARNTVARARTHLASANADLADAINDAVTEAGRPGHHGTALVNPKPSQGVSAATDQLADAVAASRATPSHVPLGQVRPGARLLDEAFISLRSATAPCYVRHSPCPATSTSPTDSSTLTSTRRPLPAATEP